MLGEILELARKISTERRATVFVEYMAHVDMLIVMIYLGGWESGSYPDLNFEKHISAADMQDILSALRSIYNDEPPIIKIGQCELCRRDIMDGDWHKEVRGNMLCAGCVESAKTALCEATA